MSTINDNNDFQAWIDRMYDDLPDIATLRHLVESKNQKVVIFGNAENMNRFIEYFESFEVIDESNKLKTFNIKAHDRRYMLLEPKLKPLRQDPFWTQQGKHKKGKRGRY